MPCFHPLQASFLVREDGKKDIYFSNSNAKCFAEGRKPLGDNNLMLPCGKCMGCRLEKSRQWATRCMHEASLYEDNCFITLTYNDDNLPVDGSLVKHHCQDFMKRLRRSFDDRKIRVFYCGEYGDKLGRPHYHMCIFNFNFTDRVYWKTVGGCKYYVSSTLDNLWSRGFCTIGELTFESAAYVARYCTKKISGEKAEEHYRKVNSVSGELVKVLPEFAQMSLKPGIGRVWLEKYGKTDVFPYDQIIVRGVKCKPPRYYDKILEKEDPVFYEKSKERRKARSLSKEKDQTYLRLLAREKCHEARIKRLVRGMEIENL